MNIPRRISLVLLALLIVSNLGIAKSLRELTVRASWYGKRHEGRRMANGKKFDRMALTAAHKTLPFGTCLQVSNPATAASVIVEVTDRGPFIKGRSLDLSEGAAKRIGLIPKGIMNVDVRVLGKASVGCAEYEPDAHPFITEWAKLF